MDDTSESESIAKIPSWKARILDDIEEDFKKENSQLMEDMEKAFAAKDPSVFDVTIKCQGSSFMCSKFMLTSRSQVFRYIQGSTSRIRVYSILATCQLQDTYVASINFFYF